MRIEHVRIAVVMFLAIVLSHGVDGNDSVKRCDPFCEDSDSYTPLCTNLIVTDTCHYGNIANTLKWQRDAVKQGLANYFKGNPVPMAKAAFYMAAYARKLERGGKGYAAATNAYCALVWLQKSAERVCDEARVACYCCFGFGGALGFHGSAMWSGFPSCYLKAWHTYGTYKKCIGWQQPSESIEIVRIDFTGLDVRAHVEKLLVEMDADIVKAEERCNKAIRMAVEKRKREEEAELQRRLRELE